MRDIRDRQTGELVPLPPMLLINEEQVKLQGMLNALPCLKSHLEYSVQDAQGRIFLSLTCQRCDQGHLCRKLKLVMEEHINGYARTIKG